MMLVVDGLVDGFYVISDSLPELAKLFHNRDFIYLIRYLAVRCDTKEGNDIKPDEVIRGIEYNYSGSTREDLIRLCKMWFKCIRTKTGTDKGPNKSDDWLFDPAKLRPTMQMVMDSFAREIPTDVSLRPRFKLIIDPSDDYSQSKELVEKWKKGDGVGGVDRKKNAPGQHLDDNDEAKAKKQPVDHIFLSNYAGEKNSEMEDARTLAKVRVGMEFGHHQIVFNGMRLFGHLFDLLNQNYSEHKVETPTGDEDRYFANVAIRSETYSSVVHDQYRFTVVMREKEFERIVKQHAPLLSRFEKVLLPSYEEAHRVTIEHLQQQLSVHKRMASVAGGVQNFKSQIQEEEERRAIKIGKVEEFMERCVGASSFVAWRSGHTLSSLVDTRLPLATANMPQGLDDQEQDVFTTNCAILQLASPEVILRAGEHLKHEANYLNEYFGTQCHFGIAPLLHSFQSKQETNAYHRSDMIHCVFTEDLPGIQTLRNRKGPLAKSAPNCNMDVGVVFIEDLESRVKIDAALQEHRDTEVVVAVVAREAMDCEYLNLVRLQLEEAVKWDPKQVVVLLVGLPIQHFHATMGSRWNYWYLDTIEEPSIMPLIKKGTITKVANVGHHVLSRDDLFSNNGSDLGPVENEEDEEKRLSAQAGDAMREHLFDFVQQISHNVAGSILPVVSNRDKTVVNEDRGFLKFYALRTTATERRVILNKAISEMKGLESNLLNSVASVLGAKRIKDAMNSNAEELLRGTKRRPFATAIKSAIREESQNAISAVLRSLVGGFGLRTLNLGARGGGSQGQLRNGAVAQRNTQQHQMLLLQYVAKNCLDTINTGNRPQNTCHLNPWLNAILRSLCDSTIVGSPAGSRHIEKVVERVVVAFQEQPILSKILEPHPQHPDEDLGDELAEAFAIDALSSILGDALEGRRVFATEQLLKQLVTDCPVKSNLGLCVYAMCLQHSDFQDCRTSLFKSVFLTTVTQLLAAENDHEGAEGDERDFFGLMCSRVSRVGDNDDVAAILQNTLQAHMLSTTWISSRSRPETHPKRIKEQRGLLGLDLLFFVTMHCSSYPQILRRACSRVGTFFSRLSNRVQDSPLKATLKLVTEIFEANDDGDSPDYLILRDAELMIYREMLMRWFTLVSKADFATKEVQTDVKNLMHGIGHPLNGDVHGPQLVEGIIATLIEFGGLGGAAGRPGKDEDEVGTLITYLDNKWNPEITQHLERLETGPYLSNQREACPLVSVSFDFFAEFLTKRIAGVNTVDDVQLAIRGELAARANAARSPGHLVFLAAARHVTMEFTASAIVALDDATKVAKKQVVAAAPGPAGGAPPPPPPVENVVGTFSTDMLEELCSGEEWRHYFYNLIVKKSSVQQLQANYPVQVATALILLGTHHKKDNLKLFAGLSQGAAVISLHSTDRDVSVLPILPREITEKTHTLFPAYTAVRKVLSEAPPGGDVTALKPEGACLGVAKLPKKHELSKLICYVLIFDFWLNRSADRAKLANLDLKKLAQDQLGWPADSPQRALFEYLVHPEASTGKLAHAVGVTTQKLEGDAALLFLHKTGLGASPLHQGLFALQLVEPTFSAAGHHWQTILNNAPSCKGTWAFGDLLGDYKMIHGYDCGCQWKDDGTLNMGRPSGFNALEQQTCILQTYLSVLGYMVLHPDQAKIGALYETTVTNSGIRSIPDSYKAGTSREYHMLCFVIMKVFAGQQTLSHLEGTLGGSSECVVYLAQQIPASLQEKSADPPVAGNGAAAAPPANVYKAVYATSAERITAERRFAETTRSCQAAIPAKVQHIAKLASLPKEREAAALKAAHLPKLGMTASWDNFKVTTPEENLAHQFVKKLETSMKCVDCLSDLLALYQHIHHACAHKYTKAQIGEVGQGGLTLRDLKNDAEDDVQEATVINGFNKFNEFVGLKELLVECVAAENQVDIGEIAWDAPLNGLITLADAKEDGDLLLRILGSILKSMSTIRATFDEYLTPRVGVDDDAVLDPQGAVRKQLQKFIQDLPEGAERAVGWAVRKRGGLLSSSFSPKLPKLATLAAFAGGGHHGATAVCHLSLHYYIPLALNSKLQAEHIRREFAYALEEEPDVAGGDGDGNVQEDLNKLGDMEFKERMDAFLGKTVKDEDLARFGAVPPPQKLIDHAEGLVDLTTLVDALKRECLHLLQENRVEGLPSVILTTTPLATWELVVRSESLTALLATLPAQDASQFNLCYLPALWEFLTQLRVLRGDTAETRQYVRRQCGNRSVDVEPEDEVFKAARDALEERLRECQATSLQALQGFVHLMKEGQAGLLDLAREVPDDQGSIVENAEYFDYTDSLETLKNFTIQNTTYAYCLLQTMQCDASMRCDRLMRRELELYTEEIDYDAMDRMKQRSDAANPVKSPEGAGGAKEQGRRERADLDRRLDDDDDDMQSRQNSAGAGILGGDPILGQPGQEDGDEDEEDDNSGVGGQFDCGANQDLGKEQPPQSAATTPTKKAKAKVAEGPVFQGRLTKTAAHAKICQWWVKYHNPSNALGDHEVQKAVDPPQWAVYQLCRRLSQTSRDVPTAAATAGGGGSHAESASSMRSSNTSADTMTTVTDPSTTESSSTTGEFDLLDQQMQNSQAQVATAGASAAATGGQVAAPAVPATEPVVRVNLWDCRGANKLNPQPQANKPAGSPTGIHQTKTLSKTIAEMCKNFNGPAFFKTSKSKGEKFAQVALTGNGVQVSSDYALSRLVHHDRTSQMCSDVFFFSKEDVDGCCPVPLIENSVKIVYPIKSPVTLKVKAAEGATIADVIEFICNIQALDLFRGGPKDPTRIGVFRDGSDAAELRRLNPKDLWTPELKTCTMRVEAEAFSFDSVPVWVALGQGGNNPKGKIKYHFSPSCNLQQDLVTSVENPRTQDILAQANRREDPEMRRVVQALACRRGLNPTMRKAFTQPNGLFLVGTRMTRRCLLTNDPLEAKDQIDLQLEVPVSCRIKWLPKVRSGFFRGYPSAKVSDLLDEVPPSMDGEGTFHAVNAGTHMVLDPSLQLSDLPKGCGIVIMSDDLLCRAQISPSLWASREDSPKKFLLHCWKGATVNSVRRNALENLCGVQASVKQLLKNTRLFSLRNVALPEVWAPDGEDEEEDHLKYWVRLCNLVKQHGELGEPNMNCGGSDSSSEGEGRVLNDGGDDDGANSESSSESDDVLCDGEGAPASSDGGSSSAGRAQHVDPNFVPPVADEEKKHQWENRDSAAGYDYEFVLGTADHVSLCEIPDDWQSHFCTLHEPLEDGAGLPLCLKQSLQVITSSRVADVQLEFPHELRLALCASRAFTPGTTTMVGIGLSDNGELTLNHQETPVQLHNVQVEVPSGRLGVVSVVYNPDQDTFEDVADAALRLMGLPSLECFIANNTIDITERRRQRLTADAQRLFPVSVVKANTGVVAQSEVERLRTGLISLDDPVQAACFMGLSARSLLRDFGKIGKIFLRRVELGDLQREPDDIKKRSEPTPQTAGGAAAPAEKNEDLERKEEEEEEAKNEEENKEGNEEKGAVHELADAEEEKRVSPPASSSRREQVKESQSKRQDDGGKASSEGSAAWRKVLDPKDKLRWLMLTFGRCPEDAVVLAAGEGGLDEFKARLAPDQVVFGGIQCRASVLDNPAPSADKFLFVQHIGEQVPGGAEARRIASAARDHYESILHSTHLAINVSSAGELQANDLEKKLVAKFGAQADYEV